MVNLNYCTVLVLYFSTRAFTALSCKSRHLVEERQKDMFKNSKVAPLTLKPSCVFSSKGVPPGPRLPTNGSLGVMSTQPRPPAPNSQQKGPVKTQAMQRQLTQQQHVISNKVSYIYTIQTLPVNKLSDFDNLLELTNHIISIHYFVFAFQDKDNTHDQFSRHLTRPPPDYKQSRSMVGVQQGNIFTGIVHL